MSRSEVARLAAREYDLLVVGGGIYGAAAAYDAARRGLSVALIEAADYGSGVSWNSLKTVHGGLRYLQTADFRRMRTSILERRRLLRIAPELVRPLPFLVPAYGHGSRGREALAIAMRLADLAGFDRNRGLPPDQQLPGGRVLRPADVRALVPGLPERGLTGGALYYDAQVSSSERLLLALVRGAVAAGAVAANYCEAVGLERRAARVIGARLRDHEAGGELTVRARQVLNASGPRMELVAAMASARCPAPPLLWAFNLVLSRPVVAAQAVGARSGGRFLFLVPWNGHAIVGTDYVAAGEPPQVAPEAAPGRFLDEAARAFPWAGLTRGDVCLVHRGLVPGRAGAAGLATRPLLIDHETSDGVPGLISILGVKYTTAGHVAGQAVDLACRRLGRGDLRARGADEPLVYARPALDSASLADPVSRARALAAAARRAVRDEQALHLADAVLRRLDLGGAGPPPEADAAAVAHAMAAELGWDAARLAAERETLAAAFRASALPAKEV